MVNVHKRSSLGHDSLSAVQYAYMKGRSTLSGGPHRKTTALQGIGFFWELPSDYPLCQLTLALQAYRILLRRLEHFQSCEMEHPTRLGTVTITRESI